ncbi:MAG: pilus assembly protein PilP [Deltaproteobacteria bacterium]|nr:pilus assembly protein PilP [Deltaproteobacteria bacterium]
MQCIHKINILCFALLIAAGLLCVPAQATENVTGTTNPSQPMGEEPEQALKFEYQLEGRPDPFTPFISDKAASQKIGADDIIEEDVELTGMRQFEPGQLTLVAVMYSGNRRLAMVEDVTGKGYILNEGMPIGRRGVISRIDGEQVTVIETAHTRAGRELETTIVIRLNKEGD